MKLSDSEKIAKYTIQGDGGCLLWSRSLDGRGYGKLWSGGKCWQTHRLAWTLENGPIPDGMCVCHKCDVPRCCNVEHLFLGTQGDNMRDMHSKGRKAPWDRAGESNGNSKLTSEQVAYIRSGREPVAVVAARFGVSLSTAYNAKRGTTWK